MTKLRSHSFAATLLAATLLSAPAFAIDLGGGLGGSIGGAIGPSGLGGSIGGTVNGTIDSTMRTGDRIGAVNDRANRVIDRTQERVNTIKVPEAPSAEDLASALKTAGYADAAVETPAGEASGSAEGSANAPVPAVEPPALPDPNAAVDQVQTVKDAAVTRAASMVPETGSVSVSASGGASGEVSTEADEPAPSEEQEEAATPSPSNESDK